MPSVQCAEFLRLSQFACKWPRAGLPLPIHRARSAPWRRQSRGFGTPSSTSLLSPRVKYPLLIFLAFACNELHVSFPQGMGMGMQHTGVAGSPAVAALGQTRWRQQLLARRDPGSSCATRSALPEQRPGAPQPWAGGAEGAWHLQGRQSCPTAAPLQCPPQPHGRAWWGFTELYALGSCLFTIYQSQGCLLLPLLQFFTPSLVFCLCSVTFAHRLGRGVAQRVPSSPSPPLTQTRSCGCAGTTMGALRRHPGAQPAALLPAASSPGQCMINLHPCAAAIPSSSRLVRLLP